MSRPSFRPSSDTSWLRTCYIIVVAPAAHTRRTLCTRLHVACDEHAEGVPQHYARVYALIGNGMVMHMPSTDILGNFDFTYTCLSVQVTATEFVWFHRQADVSETQTRRMRQRTAHTSCKRAMGFAESLCSRPSDITAKLRVQVGSVIRPPEQESVLAVRYDCQSTCASARCDPTTKVEAQGGGQIQQPRLRESAPCDPTAKVQVQGGGQIQQPRKRKLKRKATVRSDSQGQEKVRGAIRQPALKEKGRVQNLGRGNKRLGS
ncbi:hypothetical protein C8R45DRAFT_932937 [Mycena sanguinolenta]|nr:hypothetical protein C8R45DRAFT_932937 [Mycena sanguinolenta]